MGRGLKLLITLCVFLFLGYWTGVVSPVFADENFDISLSSTYIVHDTGNTTIQQTYTLTNKKPTLYAKQYALEVGGTKLKNVRVYSEKGTIPANIVTTDNKTSIGITFEDVVVGEGKSRTFTIQFDNPDTALVSGQTLEVSIPPVSRAETYTNYQVILKVPAKYGAPARVTPNTYTIDQKDNQIQLRFTQLGSQSILALFGQKQIYEYSLRYNLENPTGNRGIIQIALPPDTAYQKVEYIELNPHPKEMIRDADGNWIGTYELEAEKNLDVYLTGRATIYLEPLPDFTLPAPTNAWRAPAKYWESDSVKIRQIAQENETPKDIYDHVVGSLTYNYAKFDQPVVERLGAVGALNQPTNAACQEFTDLFIAIARAAGVPARRATGFAYTENERLRPLGLIEDVLHTWPEYYDEEKQRWIPVDPTWGNTTGGINYFDHFDFNHLVFAINGASSTTPYGAGAYKRTQERTKDVEVKFGKETLPPELAVDIRVQQKLTLGLPLTSEYQLVITNKTGAAWYSLPVELESSESNITFQQQHPQVEYLLPFQTRTYDFTVKSSNWVRTPAFTLTASLNGLSSTHDVTGGFSLSQVFQEPVLAASVGGCLVFLAVFTGSLLVFRRTRQRSLRR